MTEGSQKAPGRVNAGYLGIWVSWVFAQMVVPTRLSRVNECPGPRSVPRRGAREEVSTVCVGLVIVLRGAWKRGRGDTRF